MARHAIETNANELGQIAKPRKEKQFSSIDRVENNGGSDRRISLGGMRRFSALLRVQLSPTGRIKRLDIGQVT
jgi:hypothetical protein